MLPAIALGTLLAAVAPPAADPPKPATTSAVDVKWLDRKSRFTNAAVLNVCVGGELARAGLKPSRLAAPPMKRGRMLVGFPAGALAAMKPADVQALRAALGTCLGVVLDDKDKRKLTDDAVKDATIRALFRIAEGDTADAPELIIDAASGKMVPVAR